MNGFVTKSPIKADSNGQVPTTINLLKAGTWNTPWHGDFELTGEDLEEMATNFAEGVGLVLEDQPRAPINEGHNMGGKASGWIKRLYVQATNGTAALLGDVEWTPAAEQAIKDKEWSYISPEFNPRGCPWEDPEQEFTFVDNVLTGAALTNIPLFKKLKPITASRVPPSKVAASQPTESDKSNQGEHMNAEDLRAKEAKDLKEDEKTFLAEHKTELTDDERAKFGLEDKPAETPAPAETAAPETQAPTPVATDGADKIEASAIAGRVAELEKKLEASTAREEALRTKIETKEINEFLTARVKAGQIKQGSKDNWLKTLLASRGDTRTALETQLKELPVNENIGKELGDQGKEVAFETEIDKRVEDTIKASAGKLTYSAALKQLMASDKDFRERINAERANQNKES